MIEILEIVFFLVTPLGRRDFPQPIQTGTGTQPTSYILGTEFSPGVKWPVRGLDHPSRLPPRLKKE